MKAIEVDTIATLSTAPGVGAIAIVRLSGPDADAVLSSLLSEGVRLPEPRRASLRELLSPSGGEVLDRALVTRFRGPESYTGEDMVELSCHGGWIVPQLVLDACVQAGARLAEPGELTRRAYLHGKMDLVQVDAVADLIDARSAALHRAAVHQLDRNLSNRIATLREEIVHLEALLAHHVDFPEEDDAPVEIRRVLTEGQRVVDQIEALLGTAPQGALLREGAVVVLAGPPNAGKSALYNALLGEDRALVTPEAGTTRDALEAKAQIGGFPFRLIDTAGLREGASTIEELGIEVAERYLDRADVVLVCASLDDAASEGLPHAIGRLTDRLDGTPLVLVETKADVAVKPRGDTLLDDVRWAARVRVSAVTGEGLDVLHDQLPKVAFDYLRTIPVDAPVLTRARHARALETAASEVGAFIAGLQDELPAEVAATHLRSALTALEELVGVISVDDVLDVVFRDFCIGK